MGSVDYLKDSVSNQQSGYGGADTHFRQVIRNILELPYSQIDRYGQMRENGQCFPHAVETVEILHITTYAM